MGLFSLFTGILVGSVYGMIFGWSIFEPDSGIWLATTLVGAIVGGFLGRSSAMMQLCSPLSASAIGLYLGWFVAYWIFRSHLGGEGFMIVLFGAFAGLRVGMMPGFTKPGLAQGALLGALHFGFLGGFVIRLIFWILPIMNFRESIVFVWAMTIIGFGIVGALVGAFLNR